MPLRSDPEPPLVDQAYGDRARPVALVRAESEVLGGVGAKRRQRLGEVKQSLELRALLRCPEARVVDVLAPSCRIHPGRLHLGAGFR